ncbi:hypothetical protein GLYMA_09G161250v4 [Glycine max]|nr:hypothetical protein GLYMA_09G161250v4 [Glycine max]KAH1043261.1 hypothetical protein GYH30_025216 [Glycine max]
MILCHLIFLLLKIFSIDIFGSFIFQKMLVSSFGDCHLIDCQHVITCSSVES